MHTKKRLKYFIKFGKWTRVQFVFFILIVKNSLDPWGLRWSTADFCLSKIRLLAVCLVTNATNSAFYFASSRVGGRTPNNAVIAVDLRRWFEDFRIVRVYIVVLSVLLLLFPNLHITDSWLAELLHVTLPWAKNAMWIIASSMEDEELVPKENLFIRLF